MKQKTLKFYEGNHLTIGVNGLPPNFFVKDGEVGGSDVLLMELLAKKFDFSFEVKFKGGTADVLVNLVIFSNP